MICDKPSISCEEQFLAQQADQATAVGLAATLGNFMRAANGQEGLALFDVAGTWAGRIGVPYDAWDAISRGCKGDLQGASFSIAKTALGVASLDAAATGAAGLAVGAFGVTLAAPLAILVIGAAYGGISVWQSMNDMKKCYPLENPTFGNAPYVKSPLVIDLDGDGIATYSIHNKGVYFDIDADGFAEATGWINNKDAFLVLDKNGNGVIDNANELFGDSTKLANGENAVNGFEALKELDTNGDGVIDANDAGWENLMLWADAINDGLSQSEELISVTDAGIERIELNYQNQELTDENGNEHRQTATVHWQDGHTTVIEDIWFQTNQALSFDTQGLDITDEEWEELSVLPYIDGFGNV